MGVETNWQGDMVFETENKEANIMTMDAAVKFGGTNKGLSPMEALLGSMSGCMSMDIISMLRRYAQNDQIKSMRMEANGITNEERPHYYTDINVTLHMDGDIPAKRIWTAMRKSEEKYCSVRNTLKSDVNLKLILNGEEVPEN